jgi:hypothetical protein
MSLPLAILIIFLVVGLCTLVFLALAPSQQIPAPSGRSASSPARHRGARGLAQRPLTHLQHDWPPSGAAFVVSGPSGISPSHISYHNRVALARENWYEKSLAEGPKWLYSHHPK